VTDRECGNGVGIRHGSGWFTQYCHLAQGSIAVSVGDRVAAGTVLGQIGFSGVTSYPHLHFDVRKDGVPVDPFSGASPNTDTTCTPPDATEEATLWRDLPAYQDGGLVRIGFAGREVAYEEVQAGFASPATLPVTTPVLIAWLHGYAGQEGDALSLTVTGPDGSDWTTRDVTLGERGLKFFYRYTGRRLTTDAWDPGLYTLTVRHSRDGALIEEDIATITLTDR
ncbi:MAG: M23 family metallopeptidase, partial [Planctomycetota bacterium]